MASNALGFLILSGLRALAWAYYLLPRFLRRAGSRLLAGFLRTVGFRAKVIRENLAIAYPGDTEEARRTRAELFKAAYTHLGQLFLEILMLVGPMRRFVQRESVLLGAQENYIPAQKMGRGVILLSSHVGNWEVMGATGGVHAQIDPLFVTKLLKPAWMHRAIEEGRKACRVFGTYEPRTFRDVLKALKAGGAVGIVLDQFAGPPVGIRVPVFGVPVGTHSVIAMLVKRTGAPVIPVVNHRLPDGRFIVEMLPPLEWIAHEDPNYELALNTANYAKFLEGHIRQYPEQWLWSHRRFKGDLGPLREGEWFEGRARG